MITRQIKGEITEQFNIYKKELNVLRRVPLKLKGRGTSGEYTVCGSVKIQEDTIRQWIDHSHRTKFVMIHELVHAKYKELKNPFLATPLVPPSKILMYLLRELRANTIAYQILGCNDSILQDYFFNYYPTHTNNYYNLSAGYVSSSTNVELIKANPIWNKQAIMDAIDYFTSNFPYFKITSQKKIDYLKIKFIEQLKDS